MEFKAIEWMGFCGTFEKKKSILRMELSDRKKQVINPIRKTNLDLHCSKNHLGFNFISLRKIIN
jgi:hypothetical protein